MHTPSCNDSTDVGRENSSGQHYNPQLAFDSVNRPESAQPSGDVGRSPTTTTTMMTMTRHQMNGAAGGGAGVVVSGPLSSTTTQPLYPSTIASRANLPAEPQTSEEWKHAEERLDMLQRQKMMLEGRLSRLPKHNTATVKSVSTAEVSDTAGDFDVVVAAVCSVFLLLV